MHTDNAQWPRVIYGNQGRYTEAEETLKRALAGSGKTMGPDDPSTLGGAKGQADVYSTQGKLKEAEAMYLRAQRYGQGVLDQGKFKEAEDLFQQVLTSYETALSPNHITTLIVVFDLANLYSRQKRLKEADAMYQRIRTRPRFESHVDDENALSPGKDHAITRMRAGGRGREAAKGLGGDALSVSTPPPQRH
ncbi:hypothetical protein K440DRAFT_640477 [Wilcoxina mikolae CBS 423.85]|nr:hypothetical protein K440DRAFT_640477 [Wilcoxina mikolae CBS 423.85]